MKNFKLLLVLFALMLSSALLAGNPKNAKVSANLSDEIVKMFGDAKFDLPAQTINTMVTFTLNKEREIVVIDVECDCKEVVQFVEDKLDNKVLASKDVVRGPIYSLPIRLVVE